jgi:hypothetical protein
VPAPAEVAQDLLEVDLRAAGARIREIAPVEGDDVHGGRLTVRPATVPTGR